MVLSSRSFWRRHEPSTTKNKKAFGFYGIAPRFF
ncbi:MAG: hypothetical protein ACI9Y1_001492, partial [Lentisphaeria bacterium]